MPIFLLYYLVILQHLLSLWAVRNHLKNTCSWWTLLLLDIRAHNHPLGKMPKENIFDSSCCAITVLWNAIKAAMESYQSLPSTSLEGLSAVTSGVLGHDCAVLMGFPRDSISLISLAVPVGCPIWQLWVKLQEHPPSHVCAGSLDGLHLPGMHLEWPDCANTSL